MSRASVFARWSLAAAVLLWFPSFAAASGKHVCISEDTGDPDSKGYLSAAEGHYRAQGYKVQVGGPLAACMAKASPGDTVIVVAHGYPGGFKWAEVPPTCCLSVTHEYNGFGTGTGGAPNPHPAPPPGVRVHVVACDSGNDPDGAGLGRKSVVQSLIDAGNPAFGFPGRVNFAVDAEVGVVGSDDAQEMAAERNLKVHGQWMNNPPANAPGPPVPNHKSAAETQLAGKPAFAGKGYAVTLTYKAPEAKMSQESVAPVAATVDSSCGGVIISPDLNLLPALGGFGLGAVMLLLGVGGAIALRWRQGVG